MDSTGAQSGEWGDGREGYEGRADIGATKGKVNQQGYGMGGTTQG